MLISLRNGSAVNPNRVQAIRLHDHRIFVDVTCGSGFGSYVQNLEVQCESFEAAKSYAAELTGRINEACQKAPTTAEVTRSGYQGCDPSREEF